MNSILVRSSAGRKAAAVRKQMLLAKPCSCGSARDSHKHSKCKSCRSQENRGKKDRAIRAEVEKLFKAVQVHWATISDTSAKPKRKQAA